MPRVVEPLCTVANHCERTAGLRCAGPVLQPACRMPCRRAAPPLSRNALEDTCVRPPPLDRDHDDRVDKEYLFTLIARVPLSPPTGHVVAPELPRGLVAGAGVMRHVADPELP
jgi:hypothetical protein